ncbi:MAG: hypothetical protein M3467_00075 [Actinomycetota bacterium]|nr:hypothetical protein [Actinomycetota bacterium]
MNEPSGSWYVFDVLVDSPATSTGSSGLADEIDAGTPAVADAALDS